MSTTTPRRLAMFRILESGEDSVENTQNIGEDCRLGGRGALIEDQEWPPAERIWRWRAKGGYVGFGWCGNRFGKPQQITYCMRSLQHTATHIENTPFAKKKKKKCNQWTGERVNEFMIKCRIKNLIQSNQIKWIWFNRSKLIPIVLKTKRSVCVESKWIETNAINI